MIRSACSACIAARTATGRVVAIIAGDGGHERETLDQRTPAAREQRRVRGELGDDPLREGLRGIHGQPVNATMPAASCRASGRPRGDQSRARDHGCDRSLPLVRSRWRAGAQLPTPPASRREAGPPPWSAQHHHAPPAPAWILASSSASLREAERRARFRHGAPAVWREAAYPSTESAHRRRRRARGHASPTALLPRTGRAHTTPRRARTPGSTATRARRVAPSSSTPTRASRSAAIKVTGERLDPPSRLHRQSRRASPCRAHAPAQPWH